LEVVFVERPGCAVDVLYDGLQTVGVMAQDHDDLLDTGVQKRTKLVFDEGGVPPR
jgi:hypothetical protein